MDNDGSRTARTTQASAPVPSSARGPPGPLYVARAPLRRALARGRPSAARRHVPQDERSKFLHVRSEARKTSPSDSAPLDVCTQQRASRTHRHLRSVAICQAARAAALYQEERAVFCRSRHDLVEKESGRLGRKAEANLVDLSCVSRLGVEFA